LEYVHPADAIGNVSLTSPETQVDPASLSCAFMPEKKYYNNGFRQEKSERRTKLKWPISSFDCMFLWLYIAVDKKEF